jgi:hypothetical protein
MSKIKSNLDLLVELDICHPSDIHERLLKLLKSIYISSKVPNETPTPILGIRLYHQKSPDFQARKMKDTQDINTHNPLWQPYPSALPN